MYDQCLFVDRYVRLIDTLIRECVQIVKTDVGY